MIQFHEDAYWHNILSLFAFNIEGQCGQINKSMLLSISLEYYWLWYILASFPPSSFLFGLLKKDVIYTVVLQPICENMIFSTIIRLACNIWALYLQINVHQCDAKSQFHKILKSWNLDKFWDFGQNFCMWPLNIKNK